ncbi:MAG: hypothetical protein ABEJ95_00620 [Candidatus Nanohalobium sp.]
MRDSVKEGAIYGMLVSGAAYTLVQFLGYSSRSLAVILYLFLISAILINVKSEMSEPLKPYLDRLVLVAEGEELKMKKLLTGEKYRVRGDVEKL